MTAITRLDAKRRIVLPKDAVDRHGDKFVVVDMPGETLLKPLPKDPLETLKRQGRKMKSVDIEKFKAGAKRYARERV